MSLFAATLGAAAGLAAQTLLDIRYHNVNEKSAREEYIYTYANSSRTKLIGTRYYSKHQEGLSEKQ